MTPYMSYDVIIYDAIAGNGKLTSIPPHRIEVEPWARCHCVCLVMINRLLCNMTYLVHSSGQVIWPDRRSHFQIDLSGNIWNAYVSMRLVARNTMVMYRVHYQPGLYRSSKCLAKVFAIIALFCKAFWWPVYTMVFRFFLPFLVQKLFAKTLILLKSNIFVWSGLEGSKCDLR